MFLFGHTLTGFSLPGVCAVGGLLGPAVAAND